MHWALGPDVQGHSDFYGQGGSQNQSRCFLYSWLQVPDKWTCNRHSWRHRSHLVHMRLLFWVLFAERKRFVMWNVELSCKSTIWYRQFCSFALFQFYPKTGSLKIETNNTRLKCKIGVSLLNNKSHVSCEWSFLAVLFAVFTQTGQTEDRACKQSCEVRHL